MITLLTLLPDMQPMAVRAGTPARACANDAMYGLCLAA